MRVQTFGLTNLKDTIGTGTAATVWDVLEALEGVEKGLYWYISRVYISLPGGFHINFMGFPGSFWKLEDAFFWGGAG